MKEDRKSMTHNCYGRFCYKTGNCFHSHIHLLFAMASKCAFNFICLFVCLFWFVLLFAHSTYKIQTQISREKLSRYGTIGPVLNVHFMTQNFSTHLFANEFFFCFHTFSLCLLILKKTTLPKFNSKMENCIFFIAVIYVSYPGLWSTVV